MKLVNSLFLAFVFTVITTGWQSPAVKSQERTPTLEPQDRKPAPEKAVLELLRHKYPEMEIGSVEYRGLMKGILLGEYPGLTEAAGEEAMTQYALRQLEIPPDEYAEHIPEMEIDLTSERNGRASLNEPKVEPLSSAVAVSYNRQAARNYALGWSKNGSKMRNPLYPNFNDDCTNFVSQALHAGGIPQRVGEDTCSYEPNNVLWYVRRSTGICLSNWAWSMSWAVAGSLSIHLRVKRYVTARTIQRTEEGIAMLESVAQIGDIIQLRAPSSDTPGAKVTYHSMIITNKIRHSPTVLRLYVSYHSGPMQLDVNDGYLRTIIYRLDNSHEVIHLAFPYAVPGTGN